MTIIVGPQSLRDAGRAAKDAAEVVRKLELDAVDGIEGAMPGSTAALQAVSLGDHWTAKTGVWSKNVDRYGEKLVAAAKRYEADDKAAEEDFN